MVVGCPKCKAKLKIADEKIKPEGTKIKCPKCQAVLLVKRPVKKAAPPPPPPPAAEVPAPPVEEPAAPAPPEMPAPQMEAPAPPVEEPAAPAPPAEKEPWPELPPEAPAEKEPWPETSTEAPSKKEPWPEIPPDELEPLAPVAPPPVEEPVAPVAPPPVEEPAAPAEGQKVLLAHSNPETVNMLKFVLSGANFSVTSASDGVAAMIKAMKEVPDIVVADVRLPKIHGVEVMKRLRTKAETKDVKVILTGTKPEAEVTTLHGAAGYIHQDRMQQGLVELIKSALAAKKEEPPAAAAPSQPATAPKPTTPSWAPKSSGDPGVDRAQRLSRTVMADIDLYNKEQVALAIQQGTFESAFGKELKEGLKLYEMRISADVRNKGDFYNDALKTFIEKKKTQLGLS